jgi:predicted NAD/FAD-dependent oxidoreductase
MRIGIVGAGMAGLSCADALSRRDHEVILFDKARGPGGRMSTRRLECAAGTMSFDHGAQYFTVRDREFSRLVADWSRRTVAAPWPEAGEDAWVGLPGMNAVIRDMASQHRVEYDFLVKGLSHEHGAWWISGEQGVQGPFEAVVIATPSEQAAPMLALHDFALARTALEARSQPCWTAMFAFARRIPYPSNILKDAGPIAWAARNNAKPDRDATECWVVQANPYWSRELLEEDPARIETALLLALQNSVGATLPETLCSAAHRWRYALSSGSDTRALWNANIRLGVCGDWLIGPRVECAWLSGKELGEMISDARPVCDPLDAGILAPSLLFQRPS